MLCGAHVYIMLTFYFELSQFMCAFCVFVVWKEEFLK